MDLFLCCTAFGIAKGALLDFRFGNQVCSGNFLSELLLCYNGIVRRLFVTDVSCWCIVFFPAAWPDEEFVHGVWLEELSMVAVASSQRRLLFLNVYAQEVDSLLLPDSKGSGAVAGVFASCTPVLEKG
jgi:hypothetical protein